MSQVCTSVSNYEMLMEIYHRTIAGPNPSCSDVRLQGQLGSEKPEAHTS